MRPRALPRLGHGGRRIRTVAAVTALLGSLTAPIAVPDLAPGAAAVSATGLPAGFQEVTVWNNLTNPSAIRFAADGRVFVIEKFGRIKIFDSLSDPTPTTYAPTSFLNNVFSYWDRGLLGLALDPKIANGSGGNGDYVYVLYAYDHILGDPNPAPRWGGTADGCPTPPGPATDGCTVSARLSRFPVNNTTISGPEQVLIEDWCQQFPSHSIGSLLFGPDGALYVTAGDGASFTAVDYGEFGGRATNTPTPINPCGDPPDDGVMSPPNAEGGALRSQDMRTSGDPTGLDGTILRVDPNTGLAKAGNPFINSSDLNARRIIAYGMRNPFRVVQRPGTNELWVGDVGWDTWEEINKIPDMTDNVAENFGWPCYEGTGRQPGYDGADLSICENLYATPSAVTAPLFTYQHGATIAGETCPAGSGSSITGMAFYPTTGGSFPSAYDGGLFFGDYSRGCIWFIPKGSNGQPNFAAVQPFLDPATHPIDIQIGPDGDLYYVDFGDSFGGPGSIRHIIPPGSNKLPTASFTAVPDQGDAPLDVQFDAGASSDPEGSALTYAWDLDGDGQYDDATGATASRSYSSIGNVTVGLRVTDIAGGTDTDSHVVMVGNTAPVPVISTPSASLTWKVGDTINFSGSAMDAQDGALPASSLDWTLTLWHCPDLCHAHILDSSSFDGQASGSFSAPDHDYPSHLELTLTATDSFGSSASVSRELDPRTVNLTLKTSPAGLKIGFDQLQSPTPFTRTVIVNSANSVSAPSPQTLNGSSYAFDHWSNGMDRTDVLDAPATNTTYTATYTRQISIRAKADAMVRAAAPGTNYGSSKSLWVAFEKSRSYLKFDVSGLSGPPSRAVIRLWVTNQSPFGGYAYRVSNSWTESRVTWNHSPALLGPALDSVGAANVGHWVEWDVTSAIAGNGTYSFRVSGGSTNAVGYASRETTHDPVLLITP
jgi:glucose/arabinose dehydrogenase